MPEKFSINSHEKSKNIVESSSRIRFVIRPKWCSLFIFFGTYRYPLLWAVCRVASKKKCQKI